MILKQRQFIGRLFYLWLGFSLVALFYPGSSQAGLPYIDKVVHFILFGILFLLARLYWVGQRKVIWSGVFLYMVAAELIQHFFIPGRGAEVGDVIAGVMGVAVVDYFLISFLKLDKEYA